MILLTVGTQLPFDRLVRAVDKWSGDTGYEVIGQIGDPGPRGYRPSRFEWHPFISPSKLEELTQGAQVIVAHAGMGSIISALRHAKPIVIMPRTAALGEHRNDHQKATAARFAGRCGVHVADDETQIPAALQAAISSASSASALPAYAEPKLIHSIRRYILTGNAAAEVPLLSADERLIAID